MKKQILSTILTMFISVTIVFTQKTITGTVTSDTEGPLIGASIQIKGTYIGTTTDFDGKYSLEVEDNNTVLIYSYIGYSNVEETVGDRNTIDIKLVEGTDLDEIVVVGSRSAGRTKLESSVPVDVLDVRQLTASAPQTNVNQMLNYVAPSFTSNTQTISDGTDHIDPASLRGLGPDQVLVLINGKRRHTSALVNVNGTFGRGNVGTDMNAIPSSAISRIEVLRDGAAAQYGSDAIAGVINVILKEDTNTFNAGVTTGAFFSEGSNFFTGGSDGESYDVSLNYGLPLGDKGGSINFTGNFESRGWTSRMKEFQGSIFNAYNGVERLAMAQGLDISTLTDTQVQSLAQELSYLSAEEKTSIMNADATTLHTADASVNPLFKDVTDSELMARGLSRSDFNMRVGQSQLRGGKFFMNLSLPIGDGAEIYSFGGLGARDGLATGFYRLPNQNRTFTPAYPNGFLPQINTDINDQSLAAGIRGKLKEWDADFSHTFGRNSFKYTVDNSANASLLNSTPFEFEAGGFSFTQNTTNFDLFRRFEEVLAGLNVGFGAEHRLENYVISAGAEDSWASYDINGQVVNSTTPSSSLVSDFFGRGRPGGAQVFPGFRPDNELDKVRNSIGLYADVEADISEAFLLGGAVRFENYSDFGSTTNFKASARYKLTDNWSLRGAFSTGFRAPSLHQIYFNSTSTLFVDGIPNEVGTFSNNSRIAKILGIPQLKDETSQNLSLGLTGRIPAANLTLTIDAYQVDIDDRVILTGTFDPSDGQTDAQKAELAALFAQANAERATFFVNSIDTRSQGIDVVLTHTYRFGEGSLKSSLSGTFSRTEQVGDVKTSDQLEGLEDVYFDQTSKIYLEQAVPRSKVNLTFLFNHNRLSAFLRNVYFGEVTEATNNVDNQQEFGAKIITDLSLGYKLTGNLKLSLGANNLFDVYPDENIPSNQSSGRFLFSRRSQQFGFQGRYLFGRLQFNL